MHLSIAQALRTLESGPAITHRLISGPDPNGTKLSGQRKISMGYADADGQEPVELSVAPGFSGLRRWFHDFSRHPRPAQFIVFKGCAP